MCEVGFGGEDCSINLSELNTHTQTFSFDNLANVPGEGSSRSASLLGGSIDVNAAPISDVTEENLLFPSSDLSPETFFDPLAGRIGQALESVPQRLKNMLAYAQHLTSETSRQSGFTTIGNRNILQDMPNMEMQDEFSDILGEQTMGCGFYDVFYEGCGTSSMCFYDAMPCTAAEPFYDFYEESGLPGRFIPHAPIVEYDEDFSNTATIGQRADKAEVEWTGGVAKEVSTATSASRVVLSPASTGGQLMVLLPDLPATNATITISLTTVGSFAPDLTVLGEGMTLPYEQETHRMNGITMMTSHYMFTYTLDTMKFKLTAPMDAEEEDMEWGVAHIEVVSLVTNFAPVAEHMQVFMPADPSGGVNTIELRGHDDECGDLEYTLTSLPTEGKVFLCTCENIWTAPILSVPQTVAGPCHRLVYQPQTNMPEADTNSMFDSITYTVTDVNGATSVPATVSLYVMPAGESCESPPCSVPSAGKPGLALSFNGEQSILMLGDSSDLIDRKSVV